MLGSRDFPREGKVSGICCLGAYGAGEVGRAQQHLWSHQFVVAAAAWEDVGAEDRAVADVLQMVAKLKRIF